MYMYVYYYVTVYDIYMYNIQVGVYYTRWYLPLGPGTNCSVVFGNIGRLKQIRKIGYLIGKLF